MDQHPNQHPPTSAEITFGRGGFVERVQYASAQPDAVNSHPDAVNSHMAMEMAPPAFTPDMAMSMTNNDTNNNASMIPIAAQSSSNGKVFSQVEKNEIPNPALSANNNNSTPAKAINNTVERIVNAAEVREASARESSLVNGTTTTNASPGGAAFEAIAMHGGPLTTMELSQLSLHCTPPMNHKSNRNMGNNNANNNNSMNLGAWASLDGDLLAALTPMLQCHVKSALGIDLVGEGRNVISQCMQGGEKNGRPVITIHQVRVYHRKLTY